MKNETLEESTERARDAARTAELGARAMVNAFAKLARELSRLERNDLMQVQVLAEIVEEGPRRQALDQRLSAWLTHDFDCRVTHDVLMTKDKAGRHRVRLAKKPLPAKRPLTMKVETQHVMVRGRDGRVEDPSELGEVWLVQAEAEGANYWEALEWALGAVKF